MTKVKDMQVIADAGTCSSRIILNGDAETPGAEVELFAAAERALGFRLVGHLGGRRRSPSHSSDHGQPDRRASAKATSCRRRPSCRPSASLRTTGRSARRSKATCASPCNTWASSFTQLGDEEPNFGLITNSATPPPGSARLIDLGNVDVTNITFDPELPAYEIANLRWGVSAERWEGAVFVNNLIDERAFLSVDRERGRSARVGYLTNLPRTYGVNFRVKF